MDEKVDRLVSGLRAPPSAAKASRARHGAGQRSRNLSHPQQTDSAAKRCRLLRDGGGAEFLQHCPGYPTSISNCEPL